MTKLCCYIQDNPPFLSVASAVFSGSLLVALKRAGLLVMKWGCRLGDGLLQLLEIGSHSHV